jgi:hypothetical protein
MNQSIKRPWSVLTIVITSIIFTPIVGGIIAGLNQINFGFRRKAWREFLLSLFAFLWYSLYFFIVDQHILEGTLRVFPLAIIYSAILTLVHFLFFLALPFITIVCAIAALQVRSWKQHGANQVEVDLSWWSAYLLGSLLMIAVGFLLLEVELTLIKLVYR